MYIKKKYNGFILLFVTMFTFVMELICKVNLQWSTVQILQKGFKKY